MTGKEDMLRILHLEDSSQDAGLIRDRLEEAGLACDIMVVDSEADFESALAGNPFDLILCDYNLPGYDGLSALKVARERQPTAPLIMISGSFGEDQAVECLQAGATDYLLKQRLERFIPAVRRALQEAEERRRRRQVETELRESEERHRLMFQSNPLPLWVYDVETLRFLAVNKAAVMQYGYSEAEFLGMTIRDIRPFNQLPQLDYALSAVKPEQSTLGRWQHRKKDGQVIHVDVSSESILLNGHPARLVLARNISDQIEAERASRRVADVIEFSLDIARKRSLSSAISYFVRALREVLAGGFAFVLILDDKTNGWRTESDGGGGESPALPELSEINRGLMAGGVPVRESASNDTFLARSLAALFPGFRSYLGVPLLSAARQLGWCSLVNKFGADDFNEEDEEVALSFASQMAVTLESRRVETALNAAEQRYHKIIEFAPVGIYQATRGGRLLLANGTLARLLGFNSVDALTDSPIRDLFVDYDEHLHSISAIRPGQSALIEGRMMRRDGSEIQIRTVVHSVRDEQGEVLYDEAFLVDVTELKASEEHARLLQQSLDKAKKVDSLGRVAATIAHEFNNVLMGIQPFAEVIHRGVGHDPSLQSAAGCIINAVKRGKGVTAQVLRFANPSEPRRQVIQVAPWLSTLEPELRQLVGDACRLDVAHCDDSLAFVADPQQLEQVLSNLVVNARQAMSRGGIIRLRCSGADANTAFSFGRLDRQETFIHLSVTDEGTGIPDDIIGSMFDPLFTTKRTGTGLGLSVAAQLIEQHGGRIGVESTVGKGTTFHLLLPGVSGNLAGGTPVPGPARRLPKRLLLVEDEAPIAEGLAGLLGLDGIEVTVVSTGAEVEGAVARCNPDIVVLDFGLPDMDGSIVYAMLQERWPWLPVVVSSGHAPSPGAEHRPAFHLQKPYPYEALVEILSSALESKEHARLPL
jgi:PAS domain S-box-containing protein